MLELNGTGSGTKWRPVTQVSLGGFLGLRDTFVTVQFGWGFFTHIWVALDHIYMCFWLKCCFSVTRNFSRSRSSTLRAQTTLGTPVPLWLIVVTCLLQLQEMHFVRQPSSICSFRASMILPPALWMLAMLTRRQTLKVRCTSISVTRTIGSIPGTFLTGYAAQPWSPGKNKFLCFGMIDILVILGIFP